MPDNTSIRERLIAIALEWEKSFGIAPAITSALSEYDAAQLLGCAEADYSKCLENQTAVTRGVDFVYQGKKYQVKGNRPSGRPGSPVTLVSLAKKDKKENRYLWDYLIWVLYNERYEIVEAWQWDSAKYETYFASKANTRPSDMRKGTKLFPQ